MNYHDVVFPLHRILVPGTEGKIIIDKLKRTKGSRSNLFHSDFMTLDTNPKNYIQNKEANGANYRSL